MNLAKFRLLFHTLSYLKPIQFVYRGKLFLRKRISPLKMNWSKYDTELQRVDIVLLDSIPFPNFYSFHNNNFTFLNLSRAFSKNIDWEYMGYGRLWCYNLNYFAFLRQEDCSKEIGCELIDDYINNLTAISVGMEPYPLSLRCSNWIYFFVKHQIKNDKYDLILYKQLQLLSRQLEYHLLGNHLLENGFSLLFGAYYFNNIEFYKKAKHILLPELKEQTLSDGANFELSPMYHCIILLRLLDSCNLVQSNALFSCELLPFFESISSKMLSWLKAIIFNNGNIPLFNDAAFGIAPLPVHLFEYAQRIGLKIDEGELTESGYRKYTNDKFELVIDVAQIGPDYQPGHAHADTFNFELYIEGRSVIVDTGISTYEINSNRLYERSTKAHNTVVKNASNSSEVWSGHRVGKRASVCIEYEDSNKLVASHNGYSDSFTHKRTFSFQKEAITILDEMKGTAEAYLHFHPLELIKLSTNHVEGKNYTIDFIGANSVEILDSYYAPEFNKRISSKCVRICFNNKLETVFK